MSSDSHVTDRQTQLVTIQCVRAILSMPSSFQLSHE